MAIWLRRREGSQALPRSVLAAIAAQQDQSERLIGWVQLAVVVTFATLYAVNPKMAISHTIVTPAIIGLYFILTVARLAAAYRVRLNRWLLSMSVLVDVGLLYGLICSFHLQYQQPATFDLKAPTLLYVFIFIALRALRFEAGYVVLAGVTAAAGWLGLVAHAIYVDPGPGTITRDYVHYMTSNSVLLGAEFDKVVTMLIVTAIIAIAISRARALLTTAVQEAQAKHNLSRFFAPEIATQISRRGDEILAGSGEARDAAILNLDLRGFTKFASARPPREVMSTLAEYQHRMVPVIQKHGGSIDKFLGDGIMATFGATTPQTDYAARALRALDDLMATASLWARDRQARGEPALDINGAVASGRVICGAVGDESRLEFTVIGDAVNLSAKLEKHNKVLGSRAVVAARTFDIAVSQGYRPAGVPRRVEHGKVAGISDAVELVVLA